MLGCANAEDPQYNGNGYVFSDLSKWYEVTALKNKTSRAPVRFLAMVVAHLGSDMLTQQICKSHARALC